MIVLLRLSAGLIVWAAGFCVIYALHGIGCANDWSARTVFGIGLHPLAMIAVWIGTTAVATAIAVRMSGRRGSPLDRAAAIAGWVAVAATIVTFLPILVIEPCL